jgi:ATP:ADP antiporter, AAA family
MSETMLVQQTPSKTWLDRALSAFADVRAGEGATAVLMLSNIFVLLVCYAVIKTVREPLILLGGGAEVRSYAAAGQALVLMAFVPAYGWLASRVDRMKLLVGVTLFFVACIELFAAAVAARVPYVGVAFFIWVGIFSISLVAQFWSFANDIYTKDAGDRLFPIIVIGMTAGAPLGSFVAARLFRLGMTPQLILQVSAALLSASVLLYLRIQRRVAARDGRTAAPLAPADGFRLVFGSRYLQLIAALIVLLNVVNTTGEYLIARMLSEHAHTLALSDATFDQQAYIGAFSGDYQFWVNVVAFALQAFVTSRLVRFQGMRGALLALPLVALGGYAIVAAGVGFSVVRWIKTAENATDYSIMNTARQLLWLPTTREEKYKAKQAIDTFFMRVGDVLSAVVVYVGTAVIHANIEQFASANIVLVGAWLGIAVLILTTPRTLPRLATRRLAAAVAGLAIVAVAAPAAAQESREEELAAQRQEKARQLRPYEPEPLERRIEMLETVLMSQRSVYTFIGSAFPGTGFAGGPGFRKYVGDTGLFDMHAGWSSRNAKVVDAKFKVPEFGSRSLKRLRIDARGQWVDVPNLDFYGVGNHTTKDMKAEVGYRALTVGATARLQAARLFAVGGGVDQVGIDTEAPLSPSYARYRAFAELDSRTSGGYTRSGGFYRVDWTGYQQTNAGRQSFRRLDAEANHFIPLLRENWVIALRAMASTTSTADGNDVPFYLLPDLGGSSTLRGYATWRFRDRNRMLLTGEYRWTAGPFADMALFVDAGKVAARARDLNFSDLRASYGIGMTLHTPSATITRIEVARTREGLSLSFAFSPSF